MKKFILLFLIFFTNYIYSAQQQSELKEYQEKKHDLIIALENVINQIPLHKTAILIDLINQYLTNALELTANEKKRIEFDEAGKEEEEIEFNQEELIEIDDEIGKNYRKLESIMEQIHKVSKNDEMQILINELNIFMTDSEPNEIDQKITDIKQLINQISQQFTANLPNVISVISNLLLWINFLFDEYKHFELIKGLIKAKKSHISHLNNITLEILKVINMIQNLNTKITVKISPDINEFIKNLDNLKTSIQEDITKMQKHGTQQILYTNIPIILERFFNQYANNNFIIKVRQLYSEYYKINKNKENFISPEKLEVPYFERLPQYKERKRRPEESIAIKQTEEIEDFANQFIQNLKIRTNNLSLTKEEANRLLYILAQYIAYQLKGIKEQMFKQLAIEIKESFLKDIPNDQKRASVNEIFAQLDNDINVNNLLPKIYFKIYAYLKDQIDPNHVAKLPKPFEFLKVNV